MRLDDLKNKEFEITEEGILKVVEKKGKFVPKDDEKYWYVRSNGDVDYYTFVNDEIDKYLLNHQPVFRTIEEAEAYKHYLEVLDKYKHEFSAEEWKNENIEKLLLCFHANSNELDFSHSYNLKFQNCIYFKLQEDAENFIKEAGEENVKKFMFDVWE